MNIAFVYDGSIRDNGTAFYLRFAAVQVLGRDVDWYTEDTTAPSGIAPGHDFYIHVDDGRDDLSVDSIPHPWGYWIVDSHLGPDIRIEKAKKADLVWCAQLPFVDVLRRHGIEAQWLPLACEPLMHTPKVALIEPQYDIAFVGHLGDRGRDEFLDEMFRRFKGWYAFGLFHDEMIQEYAKAWIGVNHAVRDDLNMRFFELACAGIPQLAPTQMKGLAELGFRPWDHFIPYSNLHEATIRTAEHLTNPLRQADLARMARAARAKVLAAHTYTDRFKAMMERIKESTRCA